MTFPTMVHAGDDDFEDIIDNYECNMMEDDDEDFEITGDCTDVDAIFDQSVECLEKIALAYEGGQFPTVLKEFMMENCNVFEDTEENPLIYMDIFKRYTTTFERYLEEEIKKEMSEFDMNIFLRQLKDREDEISPDTLELLTSLVDFQTFKEMMICERKQLESPLARSAREHADLSIFGRQSRIFAEEQEDGIPRPDLNLQVNFKKKELTV